MRRFNKLLEEVRDNRNKQEYSNAVEVTVFKALAERYKALLGTRRKNSHKRHRHVTEHPGQEDDEDDDDSSVIPEDELVLLATQMEQV
jgi:hypothetical protein